MDVINTNHCQAWTTYSGVIEKPFCVTLPCIPMSTGSAHLYHTTHSSSAGEVQHCFPTEFALHLHFYLIWPNLRPKEGDTQASAKEAGNKPILSAALPLRCLPTWVFSTIYKGWRRFTYFYNYRQVTWVGTPTHTFANKPAVKKHGNVHMYLEDLGQCPKVHSPESTIS